MKTKGKHYVTIEHSNANYRRRKKAAAQARLNRAAVAWAKMRDDYTSDEWMADGRLLRAVRAFEKASGK